MILSKDNNTLNLTASILSAKSMLQSKLDSLGIDVRSIENALNALQNEIAQLKVDVDETKEELSTTAEELKDTTNNDKIKHLIDEVEATLDGIEINDDILEGLCLSDFIPDPVCDSECHGRNDTSSGSGTCRACYGYSEVKCTESHFTVGCYSDWDSYCTSCYENGFDVDCGQDYVDCSNGYCHAGFSDKGETCPTEFKNDCTGGFVSTVGGKDSITCQIKYAEPGLLCGEMYEGGEDDVICTIDYNKDGLTCKQDHSRSDDYLSCYGGYTDPETGKHCTGDFSYEAEDGLVCLYDYDDGDIDCFKGYLVDSNGIVSCASGHSGDNGSCESGHTWQDDIGGSCEGIFHNSTMNCRGGVAQDKTEERLMCNGDYESGNIDCKGGYGEDVDDQVVFCPHDFSDGHTTCRSGYMKQHGTETCTNKDPISCRGGCVSGYCDYCGGCVSGCDSCVGCHGSGNCNHKPCDQCHGTTVTFPCGAADCADFYYNCVANNWDHHEYD